MAQTTLLQKRFSELAGQIAAIEATRHKNDSQYSFGYSVDASLFLSWSVKARNLLTMVCGADSEQFKRFTEAEDIKAYGTNAEALERAKAVFLALKEDYEGGYLGSIRKLVQAEVFDTELDQASELLRNGYRSAAAVIAGTVLETALRELCTDAGIGVGNLNKMNADLARANVYSLLVQKRITALADIRNNAAHGHPDKFTEADVTDMIKHVGSFLIDHLQ